MNQSDKTETVDALARGLLTLLTRRPSIHAQVMFETILVPLDGSVEATRALGPASALAHYLDAEIVAVTYYEEGDRDRLTALVEEQLRGYGGTKHSHIIEPLQTSAGAQVASVAIETAQSLICMSSTGRGRSAALMGNEANEVLRQVSGPIMLVGPAYKESRFRCHGPLLAAFDGSGYSETILDAAESFTQQFDYDLEIVWVSDPDAAATLARVQTTNDGSDGVLETAGVQSLAEAVHADIKAPVGHNVLHSLDPPKALIEHATATNAALVAMATHNRRGLRRVLLGSTTAKVVHGAPCPVLVVRPD